MSPFHVWIFQIELSFCCKPAAWSVGERGAQAMFLPEKVRKTANAKPKRAGYAKVKR
jgi:hypothetical protein